MGPRNRSTGLHRGTWPGTSIGRRTWSRALRACAPPRRARSICVDCAWRRLLTLAPLKDAARLLLYLAAVVVLGALIAPPIYWLGQVLIVHRVVPWLAGVDFESYFNRALLLAAVALLW